MRIEITVKEIATTMIAIVTAIVPKILVEISVLVTSAVRTVYPVLRGHPVLLVREGRWVQEDFPVLKVPRVVC